MERRVGWCQCYRQEEFEMVVDYLLTDLKSLITAGC